MNARQKAKKYKKAFDRLNELNNIHNVYSFSYTNLEEVKLSDIIYCFPHREKLDEEMLIRFHTKHLAEKFEDYLSDMMKFEENELSHIAKIRFWIERK